MKPLRTIVMAASLGALAAPTFAQEYLPLAKGNTWTYDAEVFTGAAGFGVKATTTVTAKVTAATGKHHVIHWTDGQGKLDLLLTVRAQGGKIWVKRSSKNHMFLLPADLSGGRAHLKVVIDGEAIELDSLKVGKKTSLTVPAGTFEAFPVTNSVTVPGVVIKTSVWYAAGTGPVQIEELVTTGGTATVKRTLKLKSFTKAAGGAVEVPARPKTGDAPRDAQPAKTRSKAGALAPLVAGLIKSGRSTQPMRELESLVKAVLKRAGADSRIPAALTALLRAPLTVRHEQGELESETSLADAVLIAGKIDCEGSIKNTVIITRDLKCEGRLKDSIVIVDGDVDVEGFLKDCIVICTGRVKGDAYIKDNLIVSLKTVHADAYLKDNVIEAKQGASADAYSKNNLFLSTRLKQSTRSKNDVHTTPARLPSALLGKQGKRAAGDRRSR